MPNRTYCGQNCCYGKIVREIVDDGYYSAKTITINASSGILSVTGRNEVYEL